MFGVSIHAFRGEGDTAESGIIPDSGGVSIHAFRGEGDPTIRSPNTVTILFQSTPSGGKATRRRRTNPRGEARFNPRLPGGRRHADAIIRTTVPNRFNPRLPGGRRPFSVQGQRLAPAVSIHAFRGEGDVADVIVRGDPASFNPRLPGGRRPQLVVRRWSL